MIYFIKCKRGIHIEIGERREKLFSFTNPTPFQYLWLGLTTSILGNHLLRIALIWYVNEQFIGTTGATALSISQTLPIAIVAIFAGVLADRYNKKILLYIGDLAQSFIMFLLFVIFTSTTPTILHISVFSAISGIFSVLHSPVSQTIILELSKGNPEQAIKMNSWILSTNSILGAIGPAFGGVLVTLLPIKVIIIINALTFLFSFLTTYLMGKVLKSEGRDFEIPNIKRNNFFLDAKQGVSYVFKHPVLSPLFITFAFLDATTNSLTYLLPQILKNDLNTNSSVYGTALALGMVARVISIFIFNKTSLIKKRGLIFCSNLVIQAIGVLCISLTDTVLLIFLGYILLGIPSGMVMVCLSSYIQLDNPQELRGRIFSTLQSITTIWKPIWILTISFISEYIGVQTTFLFTALILLFSGIYISSLRQIRTIQ